MEREYGQHVRHLQEQLEDALNAAKQPGVALKEANRKIHGLTQDLEDTKRELEKVSGRTWQHHVTWRLAAQLTSQ